jgi:type IV secretion system protein VirB5
MPTGEAQYVGEVRRQGALAVPESAILFQAREFIALTRSVSTDRAVLYANIEKCYDIITTSYEPSFTRALRASSPFDLVGKARRVAEIESALRVTERSYQIDWLETLIETSGGRKTARMRAVVTVKLLSPTDETIRKNPLGIYIENCEMTELAMN